LAGGNLNRMTGNANSGRRAGVNLDDKGRCGWCAQVHAAFDCRYQCEFCDMQHVGVAPPLSRCEKCGAGFKRPCEHPVCLGAWTAKYLAEGCVLNAELKRIR
jgi:hypothetical protein